MENKKIKGRWLGITDTTALMHGKIYEIEAEEGKFYRVIDETHEDYLYPKRGFEIVTEEEWDKYQNWKKNLNLKVRFIPETDVLFIKNKIYKVYDIQDGCYQLLGERDESDSQYSDEELLHFWDSEEFEEVK